VKKEKKNLEVSNVVEDVNVSLTVLVNVKKNIGNQDIKLYVSQQNKKKNNKNNSK
jgi:hypothetical protein